MSELPVVPDAEFMEHVREALENGYDRCCARCGTGTVDGYEIHYKPCPEWTPLFPVTAGRSET